MTESSPYDTPDGVEEYVTIAKGYDGRTHVERLGELLAPGSEVLELGIGPGVDLVLLAARFHVVGSDLSQAFLDRFAQDHPDVELLRLDAVTLRTDRSFDAVYSNKVLHHLTIDEMRRSLERQAEVVRPGGLLLHGLWAGTGAEDRQGLHDQRYTPETFAAVVPPTLELVACEAYQEMSEADSIRVVLRRGSAPPEPGPG